MNGNSTTFSRAAKVAKHYRLQPLRADALHHQENRSSYAFPSYFAQIGGRGVMSSGGLALHCCWHIIPPILLHCSIKLTILNTNNYVNVCCHLCATQHRQTEEELPPSSAGKTLEPSCAPLYSEGRGVTGKRPF